MEEYNGNERCEAAKVDGMAVDCGNLADWRVGDQFFCTAHLEEFAKYDYFGKEISEAMLQLLEE